MIGARTSILIISSVGYRHIGEYRCNAINDAGMDSYSAELKVNGDSFDEPTRVRVKEAEIGQNNLI